MRTGPRVAGSLRDEQTDRRRPVGIAEVRSSEVWSQLLTGRRTWKPEGSGPGRGRFGHAFVPALGTAAREGVDAVSGSMEGEDSNRVLECGRGGGPGPGGGPAQRP